jgi:molybdopterin-binding protein
MISTNIDAKLSTPNTFKGVIQRKELGSVNAEVIIAIGENSTICSNITVRSVKNLDLTEGMEVIAFCSPSSIILGTI